MAVDVVSFGCRLNAHEAEVIRAEATAAGLSDTVIVNTCAVTAEAVRQARQTVRRLRRERPNVRIVVTGCAAQTEPESFGAMAEVDRGLGNHDKLDPTAWRTRSPSNPPSNLSTSGGDVGSNGNIYLGGSSTKVNGNIHTDQPTSIGACPGNGVTVSGNPGMGSLVSTTPYSPSVPPMPNRPNGSPGWGSVPMGLTPSNT